jgi:molybdate transport system substrate-binding protein
MRRLLLLFLLVPFQGCTKPEDKTLTVAAAVSLKEPLEELAKKYEASHPHRRVSLDLGASGDLATQIERGAPVDVFVSAAQEPVDRLKKSKPVTDRCTMASNALVLVARLGLEGVTWDNFASKSEHIALGLTPSVPAGVYAEQTLQKLGAWDAAKPKIVRGANVRAVLDLVAKGEADVGFVYATDVRDRKDVTLVGEPPESARPAIAYPLVLVTTSDDTRALGDFLCSDEAKAVLSARGFRTK